MREILHFHKCWKIGARMTSVSEKMGVILTTASSPGMILQVNNPQTKNDINKSVQIHMSHEKNPLTFHYTGRFNNDP